MSKEFVPDGYLAEMSDSDIEDEVNDFDASICDWNKLFVALILIICLDKR